MQVTRDLKLSLLSLLQSEALSKHADKPLKDYEKIQTQKIYLAFKFFEKRADELSALIYLAGKWLHEIELGETFVYQECERKKTSAYRPGLEAAP